jgi:hypothetical protein
VVGLMLEAAEESDCPWGFNESGRDRRGIEGLMLEAPGTLENCESGGHCHESWLLGRDCYGSIEGSMLDAPERSRTASLEETTTRVGCLDRRKA